MHTYTKVSHVKSLLGSSREHVNYLSFDISHPSLPFRCLSFPIYKMGMIRVYFSLLQFGWEVKQFGQMYMAGVAGAAVLSCVSGSTITTVT